MKILKKIKSAMMCMFAAILFTNINVAKVNAEENIASGIYELANDVYHESEIGMSMSRSYLDQTMTVKITKDEILYTIGFTGTEYMENYRIKVNEVESPVDIVEENPEEGSIKLQVKVDSLDDALKACIYVGPMERDVEFEIIPNFDTLTLIEAIEEPTEEVAEELAVEENALEENNEASVKDESAVEKSSNTKFIVIGGVVLVAVVVIGAVLLKKKK